MKAITLHQPWATLVALGVKTIETRSWAPPKALIGERLLIHAGAKDPQTSDRWTIRPDMTGEVQCHLAEPWTEEQQVAAGYPPDGDLRGFPVPVGAIVASCILADAVPMVENATATTLRNTLVLDMPHDGDLPHQQGGLWLIGSDYKNPRRVEDQRPYGDFAPGRWAWLLEDVKPTTERCPACWGRGHWLRQSAPGQPVLAQAVACNTCRGQTSCPPIPAKGHQRVWEWAP